MLLHLDHEQQLALRVDARDGQTLLGNLDRRRLDAVLQQLKQDLEDVTSSSCSKIDRHP
jgi:hypothetical protein